MKFRCQGIPVNLFLLNLERLKGKVLRLVKRQWETTRARRRVDTRKNERTNMHLKYQVIDFGFSGRLCMAVRKLNESRH